MKRFITEHIHHVIGHDGLDETKNKELKGLHSNIEKAKDADKLRALAKDLYVAWENLNSDDIDMENDAEALKIYALEIYDALKQQGFDLAIASVH